MSTEIDDFLATNLKALLQEKLAQLETRLEKKRASSPFEHLTGAESKILATLKGQSLSISALARQLKISRQAVHKVISGLVQSGLLQLEVSPHNARDKYIVFTPKGEKMKAWAARYLKEIEDEVASAIGIEQLKQLKGLLGAQWGA